MVTKIAFTLASLLLLHTTSTPCWANPGMSWIPAGEFSMGCDDCGMPEARPVHQVRLDGFWLDKTPVTNAAFAKFVARTGYRTTAQRPLDPKQFPGVPLDQLLPGSVVFTPKGKSQAIRWWSYLPGADWAHPDGLSSTIDGKATHPVVHITYEDAEAFCRSEGKVIPSEAQFEYAARGGLKKKHYVWGDELRPGGKWMANLWQGPFPTRNAKEDGYERTSPVRAFPANGYGLYDMAGNVWQWTQDWFREDFYASLKGPVTANPRGPASSYDPNESQTPKRVQKGGSFLCTTQHCTKYLVGARGKGEPNSGTSNVGFRCARNSK